MASKLAVKLREQRAAKGLSLEELARRADVSKSYVWELENRETAKPSVEKLEALAKALEVEPAYFLDDALEDVPVDMKDRQFFRNYAKLQDTDKKLLQSMLDTIRKNHSSS